MALIAKKNKTRKLVALFNMGRRFKGPVKPFPTADISSDENNQEEYGRSVRAQGGNNQGSGKIPEDEDYSDEQYPPADD